MNNSKIIRVLMIFILLCWMLAGAAMSGVVPEGKRITLVAGGPQQGSLETQYLTINYNYTWSQNQLTVSGGLNFSSSLTMNSPQGLQQFYMEVLLLDSKGEVIERRNVILKTGFSWGPDEVAAATGFKAQLSTPAQTNAMTFYYNGVSAGSVGGMGSSFWYDPSSGIQW